MMNIFNYKYLSQEQLKRLDSYKYAAIDTSPLSQYVMHPFWNYVIEFVPLTIAPNVLTLAGFACTLMNAFLLSYYDYGFTASSDDMRSVIDPVPSIVWLICAINLFLAHTLDGIDGKQARRTKATGPLGELMDHGVDSWTAIFVPMYIYSLFGSMDYSFGAHRMIFIIWAVFLTFYVTHWEKYNTGVLYLPWSYDVSQIFLFCCSIATFIGSYKIWKAAFPFTGIPYSEAFELVLYGSIFLTLPLPIYNVYSTCKSGKSRYSSLMDIIAPLKSFTLLFIASTIWATCSKNDILSKDPRVYFYLIGTIFSNISHMHGKPQQLRFLTTMVLTAVIRESHTYSCSWLSMIVYYSATSTTHKQCRLIVCQMSSTKCDTPNGLCLLFSLVAVVALKAPLTEPRELLALRLLAFVSTLAHIHYAVCVVRQMCDHFDIKALTLTRKPDDSTRQQLLTTGSASGSSETNNVGMHAIISGGSKGIGKSLAKKYAQLGYHVTIVARNERDLQAAKSEIDKCRSNQDVQKIRTISMDLTAPEITSKQQKELLGEHERCDILVNCCGSSIAARFEDITSQQTQFMMQVNYFSAVNLTRAILPSMKTRNMSNQGNNKGGQIIFVSSMCGLLSFFGYSAYSASKFALVGMAEALHMELKPFGIGVTVSFPPDTDTPGFEEENKTKPNLTAEISKAGSLFHPDDVAQAIIRDSGKGRFFSTIGLENWLVVMSSNSFMPSSFGRVLVECLLAGPLKIIAFFILKSWYSLVERSAPNEIIRAEIESKCSKRNEKKH